MAAFGDVEDRLNKGRVRPGEIRNPHGRPRGSRHRLSEDFLNALARDFERYGARAIAKCRNRRADAYVKVIASLIPKDVNLNVDVIARLAALPPAELAAMRQQVQRRHLALSGAPGGANGPAGLPEEEGPGAS